MTVPAFLTRSDLSKLFPDNPKAVMAFEGLFRTAGEAAEGVTTGAEATQSLADATVLTLSSNDAFNNERVLALDPLAFTFLDNGPGASFTLALLNLIVLNGGFRCTLNLEADTNLDMPSSGRVLTDAYLTEGPFADDAAAATGGIAVGAVYRKTGGTVAWRVA